MGFASLFARLKSTLRPQRRRPKRQERPRPAPRLEALEDRSLLSVFLVTNLDDSGAGSLRQAVLDANDRPGGDLIAFTPQVRGTIALTGRQLNITDDLAILGPGAG